MGIYRDKIINFDSAALQSEAEELFVKMGGLDQDRKNYDVEPKVIYSYYDKDSIRKDGNTITIDGVPLICNAFEQIGGDKIRGAFVYFISVGGYHQENESVLDQLLADMWGTAFVDTVRSHFRQHLQQGAQLSDEFGPGFYGMDPRQMVDLANLTDPAKISIKVRENGILLPEKSCGGFYLEVEDGYLPLDTACLDCRGTQTSCCFCNIKKRNTKMFKCTGICSECRRCKDTGMLRGVSDRKTKILILPEDFIPETEGEGYGIAFDIGTTTVVGMLWDIHSGALLGSEARINPQNVFGADVISRITFANEKPENLMLLHDKIIGCLNEITGSLCEKYHVSPETIIRAAACGNTTMSHLLAGYNPRSLAIAPFEPAYTGTLSLKAEDIGLRIRKDGTLMVLPGIAGHVGGDITAGILATRLEDMTGKTMFLDIGTNGEIVLCMDGKMLTCSTAAGPAFEGAAIYQGMRAAEGAIERIEITTDDVHFKVIGSIPPEGICGSGLIDALAEMKKAGLLDGTGRIAEAADYETRHPGSALCERLREGQAGREFILVSRTYDEDIVITQKDIREVQLAKAAIAAGMRLMMKRMEIEPGQLDRVIVAGAFGNYIDPDSAVTIGLLPDIDRSRILSAGNAAGAGTLMAAASSKEALRAQQIPEKVEHVELANEPDFQSVYLDEMSF